MKTTFLIAVLCVPLARAQAPGDAPRLGSQRAPVTFSIGGQVQAYQEGDVWLGQGSVPVALSLPVGRRGSLLLRTSYAAVEGTNMTAVRGVGDVQALASYGARVGQGTVVFGLSANLPSGKQRLATDEFATSVLVSEVAYDFRVPGFGQGFNLAPSLTWAMPVGEALAFGAGVSYQQKGAYRPLDGEASYDPGEELLITGGLDVRLGASTGASADVAYTRYGEDVWGEAAFTAGPRVTATGQLRQALGGGSFRLVGRYRNRSRADTPLGGGADFEVPSHVMLAAALGTGPGSPLGVEVSARVRAFAATDDGASVPADALRLYDVAFRPSLRAGRAFAATLLAAYTFGDLTGYGAGLTTTFTF